MFQPMDEVVCVDDAVHPEWPANRNTDMNIDGLTRGRHYFVRSVGVCRDGLPGLRLNEIYRGRKDPPYCISRFRPVKRETIEQFRQMCISTRPLVPVEV